MAGKLPLNEKLPVPLRVNSKFSARYVLGARKSFKGKTRQLLKQANRKLTRQVESCSEAPAFCGYDPSKCNTLASIVSIVYEAVELAGAIGLGLKVRDTIKQYRDEVIAKGAVQSCAKAGGGVLFGSTLIEFQTGNREKR